MRIKLKYTSIILFIFISVQLYGHKQDSNPAKEKFSADCISGFLAAPITAIKIESGVQGCFGRQWNVINYRKRVNKLVTATYSSEQLHTPAKFHKFRNSIKVAKLRDVLIKISREPDMLPKLKDFNINGSDIYEYLQLLKNRSKIRCIEEKDIPFYKSVPDKLSTIDREIFRKILLSNELYISTSEHWFSIEIENKKGDLLKLSNRYSLVPHPWHLPLKCTYKGRSFKCWSFELSRLINSCLPDRFHDKDVFANSRLIMFIAEYLKFEKRVNESFIIDNQEN